MNDYVIYVHINKINNMAYVGQTCQKPKERWGFEGIYYKGQYFYNKQRAKSLDNLRKGDKSIKAVRNIETGKVFRSMSAACVWCGLKASPSLKKACLNQNRTAGKHPETGEPLHWEFYTEKGRDNDAQ